MSRYNDIYHDNEHRAGDDAPATAPGGDAATVPDGEDTWVAPDELDNWVFTDVGEGDEPTTEERAAMEEDTRP